MNIYQDDNFYIIWKPNGIATTFWDQLNFVEILDKHRDISQTITYLYNTFANIYIDTQNEFWLVNRLDNGTGWFLLFAKNLDVFHDYKNKQKDCLIKKIYIANVYGKFDDSWMVINKPIWHHYSDKSRMTTDAEFMKKSIQCATEISLLWYSELDDISTLQITIKHGTRHQIRTHLASIGKYIVWEDLYTTKWFRKKLSENILRNEANLSKYIYTESEWFLKSSNKMKLVEDSQIYLDNYLYNKDVLTYHLWSIWIQV